jgi:hypothetical protein
VNTDPTRLLRAGAVAGPFFVVSSMLQAALRDGFDPRQQPPSALALGGAGWISQLTFVVAGIGFTLGAVGLRAVVESSAGRWAPWCVGTFGVALVAGGIFRMDPAFGFPPGTPDGVGDSVSWHAALHGILFPLGFAAIVAAGWSLSRRYAVRRRTGMRIAALTVGPVAIILSMLPNLGASPQGRFLPLWLGVMLAFGWMSFVLGDAARTVDRPAHDLETQAARTQATRTQGAR